MVKTFVAGATGYTGRAVVAELAKRGIPTVAHVRPDSPALGRWRQSFGRLGVEVDTTPWSEEAMKASVTRVEPTHVFALLGTTRHRAHREGMTAAEAYEQVDHGMTVMLLNAMVAAAPEARFVYLSAVGAGPSRSAYVSARWRTEQAILASGAPYTIVRPSFVTGRDRRESRPAERVAATVSDAILAVLAPLGARHLQERYRSVTAGELASAMVRLALDPEAAHRVFESEELHEQR